MLLHDLEVFEIFVISMLFYNFGIIKKYLGYFLLVYYFMISDISINYILKINYKLYLYLILILLFIFK